MLIRAAIPYKPRVNIFHFGQKHTCELNFRYRISTKRRLRSRFVGTRVSQYIAAFKKEGCM